MAVPKTPLSLVGFFFLFTFVASQPMDAGVFKSMGAPGDKACLMALDILGPGTSCDDRLRNAKVLNVREALRNIPKPRLDQVDVIIDQIKASAPALTEFLTPLPRDKFLKLLNALGSLKFGDWLRDCMSWCESEKDNKGISCATKSTNMGSILDRLSCISVA
ncbi:hypothetical protein MKX03_002917 [Papaver bracteatum]|nr:hypothetical protein MKX03_002917 [Papaver bracteatum]